MLAKEFSVGPIADGVCVVSKRALKRILCFGPISDNICKIYLD